MRFSIVRDSDQLPLSTFSLREFALFLFRPIRHTAIVQGLALLRVKVQKSATVVPICVKGMVFQLS